MIKALIYQSKFALTLEENAQLSIVNNFKEEIADAKTPEKNILGKTYWLNYTSVITSKIAGASIGEPKHRKMRSKSISMTFARGI